MVAWGQWGGKDNYKSTGEDVGGFGGLNKMFVILIVLALSCVYTYVKNHQWYTGQTSVLYIRCKSYIKDLHKFTSI